MERSSRVKIPVFTQGKQNVSYYRKMGETVRIKKGTIICYPGQLTKYCYYVRSGRVFSGVLDHAEEERIMFSYEKDSLLLAQYLLTGDRSSMFFIANTDVVAQRITYPELIQSMKNNFSVTLDIIQAIKGFGETALKRAVSDMNECASVRICNLFIDMADLFGEPVDGRILLNMKIRQEVIGKMTGLHRVTVVRELNKLKECRLLSMEDGNYWIPNMEKLLQFRDRNRFQIKEA